jgi:hypothetical protein
MSGIGDSPLGTSPFGIGQPDALALLESAADSGARLLDPTTGDYTIDSDTTRFTRSPNVKQLVVIALRTRLGSAAAALDLGIKLPEKLGQTFQAEASASVRAALRHLTDNKIIRVISVQTERSGERAAIYVQYRDVASNTIDLVEI